MSAYISYDTSPLFFALENYRGDTLFSQEYADLLREQFGKGLDLLLTRGLHGADTVFRYMAILYTRKQYQSHIFHLGQAAQMLVWMNQSYTPALLCNHEQLLQLTCREIEVLHKSRGTWKNPAICSSAIRQIEQHYQTIRLNDLSAHLKVNASYLSRVLSQNLHVTFLDLLHTKKLLIAMDCFLQPPKAPSLEELSADLGYSSPHYFYCVFRRYIGLTPSEVCRLMRTLAALPQESNGPAQIQ